MEQQHLPDFTQAGLHFTEASNEMQQQFQRMNNVPTVQLQQIANQLTQLTQTLDRLDQRMSGVEQRMGGIEQRMDGIEQRMDGLDAKFGYQ